MNSALRFARVSRPRHSLYSRLALLFILVIINLPTGSLFGVPVKSGIALLFIGLSVLILLLRTNLRYNLKAIIALTGTVTFLLFWIAVGYANRFALDDVLTEAIFFATALLIPQLFVVLIQTGLLTASQVFRWIAYSVLLFCTWKTVLTLLISFRILDFGQVYQFFLYELGYDLVLYNIGGFAARLTFQSQDTLVVIVLAAVLFISPERLGLPRWFAWAIVPLSAIAIFVSYARVAYVQFGIVWLLFFFYLITLVIKRRKIIPVLGVLLITLVGSFVTLQLYDIYFERFFSASTERSDQLRSEQIGALMDKFSESPLIGCGFGCYAEAVVRSESAVYNYEVQWLAFLAKLGIVGIGLFVVFLIYIIHHIYRYNRGWPRWVLIVLFGLVLLSAFFNQYLISSPAAIIYLAFLSLVQPRPLIRLRGEYSYVRSELT